MRPLLDAHSIKNLDLKTLEVQKISSLQLMEKAVQSFVGWFQKKFDPTHSITLLCGLGNNGADGLLTGVYLHKAGYRVAVLTLEGERTSEEFQVQSRKVLDVGIPLQKIPVYDLEKIPKSDLYIDALMGSGLSRPLEGPLLSLIHWINKQDAIKVSIDVPTGMPVDTFFKSPFVLADYVATFQFPKLSFFLPEYADSIPSYVVLDIGLEESLISSTEPLAYILESKDIAPLILPRKKTAHKGHFGHALLIAGSKGKMGAAVLAARAFLKSGAALLSCAVPKDTDVVMHKSIPEAMLLLDTDPNVFSSVPNLKNYAAIGIGPGLGLADPTAKAFSKLIQGAHQPLVIDADGVNLLAKNKPLLNQLPRESILTPHPKEFERLVGPFSNSIDRLRLQKELSLSYGINIVVKGAYSTLTDAQGKVYINSTGNPGMATAGSGDVLTGIITGLVAKGMLPIEALQAGVYLHGLAGDLAKEVQGEEAMLASDLIEQLGPAYKYLNSLYEI